MAEFFVVLSTVTQASRFFAVKMGTSMVRSSGKFLATASQAMVASTLPSVTSSMMLFTVGLVTSVQVVQVVLRDVRGIFAIAVI